MPAQTINQACASGLQAVALGAQAIQLGQSNVVLSGGIESMSRMPYFIDSEDARWGHKMGNFTLVDAMYRDGFFCPLSDLIMGQTAEVLARQYGITREESDAFALESQRQGGGGDRRRPVHGRDHAAPGSDAKGKPVELDRDEHPRAGATIESLRKLPLVFEPVDGAPGIITAGSSSGITDGGAAVVLASARRGERRGLTPLARISAGRPPASIRGSWASARCRRSGSCSTATGLTLDDFDLVELNEAFAPQVLAVLRDLPIDPRSAQRQRRRHRARPSDRLHRHAHSRHAAVRNGAPRRRSAASRRSASAAASEWRWRSSARMRARAL